MKFSITRQGGQYQFWHTDCEKSRSGILSAPEFLDDLMKRFKCHHCGKVGIVLMDKIVVGSGILAEPVSPALMESLQGISDGADIDLDAPLNPDDD